jgi:hypothetical protein
VAGILLAFAAPSLATPSQHKQLVARQDSNACTPGSLVGRVGASNGGRKVGIVIDESNSMQDYDPDNIRIIAGKALDESLVSKSEATQGKTADLVTVVGFHSSPDLLYPLGDPAGAIAVIDTISSSKSGTFIGGGLKEATDELTKPGNDPTANRTGIVVLTDGEDNYSGLTGVQGTINEITRAGELGIRVSFGFLSVDSSNQDPRILNAILKTGGAFTSFTSAVSQESFIAQVLLQGLTGIDASSNTTSLFPGLTTSALLSQTGSNTFSYSAKAGETFNFTITAIDAISLKATLSDTKGTELASKTTNSTGVAVIVHTATSDVDLELVVTPAGTNTSGIFSVGLQSSLGICANTTIPTNSTPTPSTTSPPVQFTGGAVPSGNIGSGSGMFVSLLGFLFTAFLL